MKRQFYFILALLLCFACLFGTVACNNAPDGNVEQPAGNEDGAGDQTPGEATPTGLWADARYLCDQEFGQGEKTVKVKVCAEDQSVTFTIHTDKQMLGEALLEHELIAGDEGPYGLYVKRVNGMLADYDVNQRYWSLSKNGEYMMTGMDMTPIADGEHYEITYAK